MQDFTYLLILPPQRGAVIRNPPGISPLSGALVRLQRPNYCPFRKQSRVVTGLLTGHNTLRIHLYVMGLSNNPTCTKCGSEEETSTYILCECEAFASLRRAHLCFFFLDPEDIMNLSRGAIWKFGKGTWLL